MNNLVFNTVASELKATVYAQAPDQSVKALQVDNSGQLLVAGSLTVSEISAPITVSAIVAPVAVSEITAPVTIGNATLTVAGTVTVSEITAPVTVSEITAPVAVSEITAPVTIGNATLTVAGTVTVSEITAPVTVSEITAPVTVAEITAPVTIGNATLTVAGTVTVSEITAPVTVSEITAPITVGGSSFFSDEAENVVVTGSGVIFPDTDISALKVASVLLYNEGATPVTFSLQMSPTTDDARYIDDPSYTDAVLGNLEKKIISVNRFAQYMRLSYDMDASTGTVSAYFNAQA